MTQSTWSMNTHHCSTMQTDTRSHNIPYRISQIIGSGVLPWGIDDNPIRRTRNVVFLFGQRQDGTWSDFGGIGAPPLDNAVRMVYEQTLHHYTYREIQENVSTSPFIETATYRLYIANFMQNWYKARVFKTALINLSQGHPPGYAVSQGATKKNFIYVRASDLATFLYRLKSGHHPVSVPTWSRSIPEIQLFLPLIRLFEQNVDHLLFLIENILAENEGLNSVNTIRTMFRFPPLQTILDARDRYITLPPDLKNNVLHFRQGRAYRTEYRHLRPDIKTQILERIPPRARHAIEQDLRNRIAGSELDLFYNLNEVVQHYIIENAIRQAGSSQIDLQKIIDDLYSLRIPTASLRRARMNAIDQQNDPIRRSAMTSEGILQADYGLLQWD